MDLALACECAEDYTNGRDMAANALRIKRDCQGDDSTDYEKYRAALKRLNRKYKAAQKVEVEKKESEEVVKKKDAQSGGDDVAV